MANGTAAANWSGFDGWVKRRPKTAIVVAILVGAFLLASPLWAIALAVVAWAKRRRGAKAAGAADAKADPAAEAAAVAEGKKAPGQ